MAHVPGLGLMFTGFNASTLKASNPPPPPPRGVNELKFIVNSGADSSFTVPTANNWLISWGDVTTSTDVTHSYPAANTEYEISITPIDPNEQGWLKPFLFSDSSGSGSATNKNKILRITSGELTKQAICVDETDDNICSDMFRGCTNLTSIGDFNLPQDLYGKVGISFCSGMFADCTSLTSLDEFTLPQGITTVGVNFCQALCYSCGSLTSLGKFNLPQGISGIAKSYFCSGIFQSCEALKSLNNFQLPPGITSTESQAMSSMFGNCGALTSIGKLQLPQGITTVGSGFCYNLFRFCTSLTNVPTSFFGKLQLSKTELDKYQVFYEAFAQNASTPGNMDGVPMLQISPTVRNKCFVNTPNVLNVPANWK